MWVWWCYQRYRISRCMTFNCNCSRSFQKSQSQDGWLPELLLAYSCLTYHREAASLWLVTPKQDVGDHQWRVVCCNVEYLNFGMQGYFLATILRLLPYRWLQVCLRVVPLWMLQMECVGHQHVLEHQLIDTLDRKVHCQCVLCGLVVMCLCVMV